MIVKIGYPHKRKFLVTGYYRQWSDIYNNKMYEPINIKNQESRFEEQLVKLNDTKDMEKIILGDFNIDYKIIYKNENEKNNYEKHSVKD